MGFLNDFFNKHKSSKSEALTVDDIDKLPTFSDVDLGLFWNRITKENMAENRKYFEEMSTWQNNKDIQKYIASKLSINQLFNTYITNSNNNLYFCCNENEDFLGMVYISSPNDERNDSIIEYLIVNPRFQKKGIGTKMVKSILSYVDYFNCGQQSNGVLASVQSDNIASSRVFIKNNFKVVSSNWSDTGRYYRVFYFSSRDNTMQDDELKK